MKTLILLFASLFILPSQDLFFAPIYSGDNYGKIVSSDITNPDIFYKNAMLPSVVIMTDSSTGSGVIVGNKQINNNIRSYVLTASHVIPDTNESITISVFDYRGNYNVVTNVHIKHRDALLDLIVLYFDSSMPYYGAILSCNEIKIGDLTSLVASDMGSYPRYRSGVVSIDFYRGNDIFVVDNNIVPGNSGGPIYNSSHELIGIITSIEVFNWNLVPIPFNFIGYCINIDSIRKSLELNNISYILNPEVTI